MGPKRNSIKATAHAQNQNRIWVLGWGRYFSKLAGVPKPSLKVLGQAKVTASTGMTTLGQNQSDIDKGECPKRCRPYLKTHPSCLTQTMHTQKALGPLFKNSLITSLLVCIVHNVDTSRYYMCSQDDHSVIANSHANTRMVYI